MSEKKIRIGLCMAGAVSAGAYTAGVVDYLIETLERWEQQKQSIKAKLDKGDALTESEQLIPLHDVCIEVLSGASAGGMTAAVLAYSLNDNSYLTKRQGKIIRENYNMPVQNDTVTKLYDSWIHMADDKEGSTFQKLMDTDDVVSIEQMKSLLNSKPIDAIAERAIPERIHFSPPPYISQYLSVILSVTNLEGIPIDIRFPNIHETNPTRNVLRMHSGFLHYQFNHQEADIDFPPEILTEENKGHLADAAKASGAFPMGLANRRIEVNHQFMKAFEARLKENYKLYVNIGLNEETKENYVFNAIDGGAINNEPIGTTVRLLDSKKKKYHPDDENYLLLIDPFPTVTNNSEKSKYTPPRDYTLIEQIPRIIAAFRNQSMFKQEDLLNGLEMDHNRYLIYPAKRRLYFLACGLLGGFSGFFKKSFREHDYQLGRKNCQAFLRYFFGEEPQRLKEITGYDFTDKQIQKWSYNANFTQSEKEPLYKIPIIPDMLMMEKRVEIESPTYDGLTTAEMSIAIQQIKNRIEKIVECSYDYLRNKGKKASPVIGFIMKLFPNYIQRKIVNPVINTMSKQLEETFYPQSLKQEVLVVKFADIIEKHGSLYQKTKGVYAKMALGGEKIISITNDGVETTNTATIGDYIITNQTEAKEQYILKPQTFNERYVLKENDYYVPNERARVHALKITQEAILTLKLEGLEALFISPEKPIYIEAPWHESQTLRINDYLVCLPSKSEVYRIAEKEFYETYALVNE